MSIGLYCGRPRTFKTESIGSIQIIQDGEYLDVCLGEKWLGRFHHEGSDEIQIPMDEAWENARMFARAYGKEKD